MHFPWHGATLVSLASVFELGAGAVINCGSSPLKGIGKTYL